ncbi:MAG: sigma-70 family RNA polymerase sigma factor [Chitinivibrionales bacterium]|nr:sigma-70 family RNA polymerase sigma factor [Chitinivibrionales bacterium]
MTDYSQLSDQALIEACLDYDGDRKVLNEFVSRNAHVVTSAINWVCLRYNAQPGDEVRDIFQSVFLGLFKNNCRNLKKFDAGKSKLSTWLITITRNTTINALKKQRPHLRFDEELFVTDDDTAEPLLAKERKALLNETVNDLTDKDKLFYHLYFEAMAPTGQIARILNIGKDTVYSKKAKLIDKLKRRLASAPMQVN